MNSVAMKTVSGLLLLSMLSACSGSDQGTQTADNGGLDGGGQFALALKWDAGVFVQPIWEEGRPKLLVTNRRNQQVSFGLFETGRLIADLSSENPATRGASIDQWQLPAESTQSLDADHLLDPALDALWVEVAGKPLGLLERPQPPLVAATLPVVSDERARDGQIETDFSLLPGPHFDAAIILRKPGHFWVEPSRYQSMDVQVLTATAASSEDADVETTSDGFHVAVPEGTSADKPMRVRLSFELPQGVLAADTMLAMDGGFLCTELRKDADNGQPQPADCANGAGLTRLVPAP
jgi:hypothetical protein